jgi:small membrane protein
MTLIQPILIFLLVTLGLLYFGKMRSKLLDRILVFIFGLAGTVLVAMPNAASAMARWVGVGRGVDLVIYLSLVGIAFCLLLLISKIRELENKITGLTRDFALNRSQHRQSS